MDTDPFDEADLLPLPASPAASSPPRRLKRLKKSFQTTAAAAITTPPKSPSTQPPAEEETLAPHLGSPSPPPNHSPPPPSEEEAVAPRVESPLPNPSPPPSEEHTAAPRLGSPLPPPPAPPADAEAAAPAPSSPPVPVSSPLPPADTAEDEEEEEDDGLDPLFSDSADLAGWDTLGLPTGEDEEEEEMLAGGGLIEELRREKEKSSAKKRLNMDEGEDGVAAMAVDPEPEVAVTGKRSKRKTKGDDGDGKGKKKKKGEDGEGKKRKKGEDGEGKKKKKDKVPNESVASKKRAEKERRAQLESIHAESQRLLRETRKASFKPVAEPVYKPISSVLEKIRLRKLEIQKMSNTPVEEEEEEEEEDASSEPESDPAEQPAMPEVKEVGSDDKDLKNDDVDKEVGANAGDLNDGASLPEDEDAVISEKDLNKCGSKSPDKQLVDNSQDNHEDNAQPSDDSIDAVDEEAHLPPSSSPTKNPDDSSSEDEEEEDEEEEDNDKENICPGIQQNDVNTHQQPRRTLAGDSRPDAALLKDFLDIEAEEEDDSDDDMARFKDNEEDDGDDENEVLTALIAAGFEEKEVDHEKRNALHQKWLQDQDAAETNNFIQRLKYGHQEQKVLMEEDEDDIEDCEDESENERSHDLTPNIVRQNSEKAKQMIAKMFTDENDTYEHSDDEEIEEHLARQRISKREVHSTSLISPLEDDSSREMFSLIKKLNIAPQPPKRRGKQAISNLEMLMVGSNSNSSSKSSFLGRTTSGPISSSHRSVYKGYIFGRDDSNSNSKSCFAASESNSDVQDQANPSQAKKAKFSSSQTKPAASGTSSEGGSSSGASLFELLRRSTSGAEKQEHKRPESFGIITESQAVHQFSAFKLSRKFSKIGARN